MSSFKIKTGDNVIVIAGKNKGKTGKVLQIFKSAGRVVVEGVNIMKKHVKSRKSDEKGQIIELAAPFHISNVMLIDPSKNTRTRVKYETRDNKKVRVAKKSGSVIS